MAQSTDVPCVAVNTSGTHPTPIATAERTLRDGSNVPIRESCTAAISRPIARRHGTSRRALTHDLTLTGHGGIGKTSLAIKAVRYLLPDFEDGGWLVELASLSDPGLVPSTVASTLGLKLAGEISAESVARAVGGSHLVLVLDNREHVIDAVANHDCGNESRSPAD
jgi:hypothetical protein